MSATAEAPRKEKKAAPSQPRVIGDKILIRPREKAKTIGQAGVIIRPDNAQDNKSTVGQVLAVGSGHLSVAGVRTPLEVQAGQWVCYPQYGGTMIEVEGEELIVLKESEILFIY